MITYADAKTKALDLNGRVNACNEYAKAFHFFHKTNEEVDGDAGVVIIKETGRAINFPSFILNYHPERKPKRVEF